MPIPATVLQVEPDALDERYGELRLVRPDVLATVRRSVQRHGILQPLVVNAVDGDEAGADRG